jgi:cytoskeletal protein RodZ
MIKLFEPQKWVMASAFSGLIVVFILIGSGCSSTRQTTKTETTATSPSAQSGNREDGVVSKSETTTTTTQSEPESPGVLSSTFHAIGYVLALPFIIVGGLFKIIFGG